MDTPSSPFTVTDPGDPAQAWRTRGRCARSPEPDLWFPDAGGGQETVATAKRLCAGCPVSVACLDAAVARNERFGVWGGLTVRERDRIREHRRAAS